MIFIIRETKDKQFYNILKKYKIKEYYCSKEFNPCEDFPRTELLLPTDNPNPALDIIDLYTDENDPEGYCSLFVLKGNKGSDIFNKYSKDLERREVF